MTKCLDANRIPTEWTDANVILLFKKGEKEDLRNYRPISLLSALYKLFTKIITNRITDQLDSNQPAEQAGFRSNYSTNDHLQVVQQIMERCNEYAQPLCMAFIDYEKAFDSVSTSSVLNALISQNINKTYVETLKFIYSNATSTFKLHNNSNKVPIRRGVRQGDTISPKLFTAVLEGIFKNLNWEDKGININGRRSTHLRFADDIIVLPSNQQQLQKMMADLNRASKKV